MSKSIHYNGLTEIRGVAALIVVVSHIDQMSHLFGFPHIQIYSTGIAGLAVTTFFTLSGFLITRLLVIEKRMNTVASIKKFYMRRILRIWPAYYLTIAISLILLVVGFYDRMEILNLAGGLLTFSLFLPNLGLVLGLALPGTSPLWSVGVEEQFYLIWPWIIKWCDNLILPILLMVGLYLVLKIAVYIIDPNGGLYALIYLTQFDSMCIGAVLGLMVESQQQLRSIVFSKMSQVLVMLVLILPFITTFKFFAGLEVEIYSIASAVWIINSAHNNSSFISIKSMVFNFLGQISYGLYVYHFVIIYLLSAYFKLENMILNYAAVLGVSILLAYLSYRYFEMRVLRLKRNFVVVNSNG